MDKSQIQNKDSAENRSNAKKCKVRCVYIEGKPPIYILSLNEPLARVVIVAGCDIYAFAFKEEAREFLREFLEERLGTKNFEVGPCPEL
jgi:hypothetical protein